MLGITVYTKPALFTSTSKPPSDRASTSPTIPSQSLPSLVSHTNGTVFFGPGTWNGNGPDLGVGVLDQYVCSFGDEFASDTDTGAGAAAFHHGSL
jgi:hypothetical protein